MGRRGKGGCPHHGGWKSGSGGGRGVGSEGGGGGNGSGRGGGANRANGDGGGGGGGGGGAGNGWRRAATDTLTHPHGGAELLGCRRRRIEWRWAALSLWNRGDELKYGEVESIPSVARRGRRRTGAHERNANPADGAANAYRHTASKGIEEGGGGGGGGGGREVGCVLRGGVRTCERGNVIDDVAARAEDARGAVDKERRSHQTGCRPLAPRADRNDSLLPGGHGFRRKRQPRRRG